MGYLVYGSKAERIHMDDRVLAHLRAVILAKFRRNEAFAINVDYDRASGSGYTTLWLAPTIDLALKFEGSRRPVLNRTWIDELMREANSPDGLYITQEPDETSQPVTRPDSIQLQRD